MPESSTSLDEALTRDLAVLDRAGYRRVLRPMHGRHGATVDTGGGAAIDFASNDYLGLASDPRIAAAAIAVLDATGATGAAAARLIAGDDIWHHRLEERIARFKGTDSALLFPTGYAANTGAIPALARRGDVIYADQLNHASLIDGCRLSRAETKYFPHGDLHQLAQMLADDTGKYRHRWIVVDAVFSMDGDAFPLDRLVPLARQYGAWTYIDDAHGSGVLGATGRGTAEHFGVAGGIDVTMGTLGKAFGTMGAYVAGSARLREWLLNRARSFIFTTASPAALAAATVTAIDLAESESWRRERLRANARQIRDGLAALGQLVPGDAEGHIVPLVIGNADETMRLGEALRDRGILVGAVRPPTVPLGGSRLRITASAAHTTEQITTLLGALQALLPGYRNMNSEPG